MTLKEMCEKYGVSENTAKKMFSRTQAQILKKFGVKIVKYGRGDSAYYIEETDTEPHALTIFEEDKEVLILNEKDISLDKWAFYVVLAIAARNDCVFRGTYRDMLSYLGVQESQTNVAAIKQALEILEREKMIIYVKDNSSTEEYFIAAFYKAVEEKVQISISNIKIVKELADANGIKAWVTLLKVLTAIEKISESKEFFTADDIASLAGVSASTVFKYKKVLEQNDFIRSSKVFAAFDVCLGTKIDLNAFYLK